MKKKILYLDIDGVLADFDKAVETLRPGINALEYRQDHEGHKKMVFELCQCHPTVFHTLEPIEGALEAVEKLYPLFDVYFLSSPMWFLPESFIGKRLWIETHFGEKAVRRLILTHRKDLCLGDYLVDDRTINGAAEFSGMHLHFGSSSFPDWKTTLPFLLAEANKKAVIP